MAEDRRGGGDWTSPPPLCPRKVAVYPAFQCACKFGCHKTLSCVRGLYQDQEKNAPKSSLCAGGIGLLGCLALHCGARTVGLPGCGELYSGGLVTRRNSRNDLQDILRYAKHCDIPIGPIERPLCPELYQMLIHVWVAPML